MEFAEIVNQLIQKFQKLEMFNLSSQFQRAADSIGYTIAEGFIGTDANFNRYRQAEKMTVRRLIALILAYFAEKFYLRRIRGIFVA